MHPHQYRRVWGDGTGQPSRLVDWVCIAIIMAMAGFVAGAVYG